MTTEVQSKLASLFVPIRQKSLLLPNVTVAEVIPFIRPERVNGAPDWWLGMSLWRGCAIPLISFEQANGEAPLDLLSFQPSRRIAIINSTSGREQLPFFSMVLQQIPRLVRVSAEEIFQEDEPHGPCELMVVRVNGELASIPNLDHLEEMICDTKLI